LRDSAEIVWPLDDITESSSVSKPINFFTNDENAYSASINIAATNLVKNPMVFGGGTLLEFTSSAVGLSIPAMDRFSEYYDNRDSTISLWFQTNSLPTEEYTIFKKRGYENIGLFIKNNYLIFRYGTSASYNELSVDFVNVKEPHHIVLSRNRSGLVMVLDGVSYSSKDGESIRLEKDASHANNNYIDFYGPPNGSWNIDAPTFYPNILNTNVAKRHYVYGLGKSVPEKTFYSRGGSLYNFTTIYTERLSDINWDYPDEWKITELVDLNNDEFGLGPVKFTGPHTYSFDNNIDTSSNKYKFSSSVANTEASYIEINKLFSKLDSGQYPFFVKFKLDGELPAKYLSQRLISIGRIANEEVLKFDLYNNNGTYQVKVSAINSSSVAFNISNVSASLSFYVGMKFDGATSLYFAQSGSAIQTASFNYTSASSTGLDPLLPYLPWTYETLLRIGSSLNYDETSFNNNVYGVEQYLGSVERFLVAQTDFSASSNYSYIENYDKPRYEFNYHSSLNRFKVKTYGHGSFNLHTINFSEYISDTNQRIGANYIGIGYPFTESSSFVNFYATLISYSGSVINPQIMLSENNYLNFLNNVDLSDKYLKIDFEIYSDDSLYYPPRVKYFKMQTFKTTNNSVVLKDDAGPSYTLYPSASSVYLPEIRYTPSIFMTEDSGIKITRTYADFTENILPKPLNPLTINGLKLWLDSRFINGLNKINPNDDTRLTSWKDLSNNNNNAIQTTSSVAPVFRTQSLNLLRMNQLDGGEGDDTSFIIPTNSTISTNVEGAISGTRGIQVIPNGSSTDSYIDVSFNTASITVFPSQSYSVVGSIKMFKPQTASSLHQNARKIVVYTTDGVTETLSASSIAANNSASVYSLSAVFTTTASTVSARILFYNGSYDSDDSVYWDNLGLYPVTASSSQYQWVQPLTLRDNPVVKFDGYKTFLQSSASISQPYTLYVVGRTFNKSVILGNSSSALLYSKDGSYYFNSGSAAQMSAINKEFNIYSVIVNSGSARFYLNGQSEDSQYVGFNNLTNLNIGKGIIPGEIASYLSGDICSILLFEDDHDSETRTTIENWLDQSFNLLPTISVITPLDDLYTSQYGEYYDS
jgi:hypothetical protein